MVRSRAVCVAAALLALTACAGGGKRPASVAPLIASSAPSASVATAAPTFPATKQGAADFVRYYIGQANRVQAGDEGRLLVGLQTSSCRTCVTYLNRLAEDRRLGSVRGGTVTPRAVTTALLTDKSAEVTASVDVQATDVLDRRGRELRHIARVQAGLLIFSLLRSRDSWLVAQYGVSG